VKAGSSTSILSLISIGTFSANWKEIEDSDAAMGVATSNSLNISKLVGPETTVDELMAVDVMEAALAKLTAAVNDVLSISTG
jgi:hypothetical protein